MELIVSKRELLAQMLDKGGLNRVARAAYRWKGLLVLNYHRIGEPGASLLDRGLWSVSAAEFERQVRHLARNFDVISIGDLAFALSGKARRCVMITFDDGYRDNYEVACPILRAQNVNATFFVTTGFLDRPRLAWWDEIAWMVRTSRRQTIEANPWTVRPIPFDAPDRQRAVACLLAVFKALPSSRTADYLDFLAEATGSGRCPHELADRVWMTWDMIRTMRRAGMSFGAHTVNHPILSRLPAEEQEMEILESRLRLESELGEQITAFSYPDGSPATFNETTRRCLANLGFDWAFSHHGGYCRPDSVDRFSIPRVPVERDVSFAEFRSQAAIPRLFS